MARKKGKVVDLSDREQVLHSYHWADTNVYYYYKEEVLEELGVEEGDWLDIDGIGVLVRCDYRGLHEGIHLADGDNVGVVGMNLLTCKEAPEEDE